KLATQIANKQQKLAVEITKPPILVTPIRNEIEYCIIIDVEDYKAIGYSDVLIFVQHIEAMMEEIDRMDEEIEMEDAEDWSVVDIDSSDKKNELTVVEYINDFYAYYKKAELVIRKKLQLVGITALLLACKCEEVFVPVVEDLVLISEKAYARKEVLEMVELVSFFLTDLCLVEYEMLRFLPSMLAVVAVFTAQCTLDVSREWKATCKKHNIYGKYQILECSKLMVSFHQKAAVRKLTGMHRKYSTSKYGNAGRCEPVSFLLEAWF
ncbi:hypothetical protein CQW23_06990, partial [Capsicum baccatum]